MGMSICVPLDILPLLGRNVSFSPHVLSSSLIPIPAAFHHLLVDELGLWDNRFAPGGRETGRDSVIFRSDSILIRLVTDRNRLSHGFRAEGNPIAC